MLYDGVGALLDAATGDLDAAAATVRPLAVVAADVSDHGMMCDAWLVIGEVFIRVARPDIARRCFCNVLRHGFGEAPYYRACALAGVAATLATDDRPTSRALAMAARTIRADHDFVMPPWLSTTVADPDDAAPDELSLTAGEIVALALARDES